jgi:hypothetical protein
MPSGQSTWSGPVLGRRGLGAGLAGRGEQLQPPGPEVAQQAGPGASPGDGQALGEVGAQRLIPALVRVPGSGEVFRAGGRFRCTGPVYQNSSAAGPGP